MRSVRWDISLWNLQRFSQAYLMMMATALPTHWHHGFVALAQWQLRSLRFQVSNSLPAHLPWPCRAKQTCQWNQYWDQCLWWVLEYSNSSGTPRCYSCRTIWNPVHLDRIRKNSTYSHVPVFTSTYWNIFKNFSLVYASTYWYILICTFEKTCHFLTCFYGLGFSV